MKRGSINIIYYNKNCPISVNCYNAIMTEKQVLRITITYLAVHVPPSHTGTVTRLCCGLSVQ